MPSNFAFTQWRTEPPMSAPVAIAYGPEPVFRDALDMTRAMYNRVPQAEYPDGYLGTINTRQGDASLLSKIPNQNQRSYQRGVHKGERIDPQDYLWPQPFNEMSGIERQARTGKRFKPTQTIAERLIGDGGTPLPPGAEGIVTKDVNRAAQLRHLMPRYA